MTSYIVFWKDGPGQQVTTVADAKGKPVLRDADYVATHNISVLDSDTDVFTALDLASGEQYAVAPDRARVTLGWDV